MRGLWRQLKPNLLPAQSGDARGDDRLGEPRQICFGDLNVKSARPFERALSYRY